MSAPLCAAFAIEGLATEDAERIEASLRTAIARGRAAWPGVVNDEHDFAAWIAARVSGDDRASAIDRIHGADMWLACACARGDSAALFAFDEACMRPAAHALERRGTSGGAIDEAGQILRERLFVAPSGGRAKIGDYSGRGPLAAWVRVALGRTHANLRRSAREVDLRDDAPVLTAVDPELAIIKRRYGEVFTGGLRDAFAALDPHARTILRMHFVDGLSLDRLALVFGVSRATAGRRVLAARTTLLEETTRILGERLRATPTELASLLAIVRSRIEISFGQMLEEA